MTVPAQHKNLVEVKGVSLELISLLDTYIRNAVHSIQKYVLFVQKSSPRVILRIVAPEGGERNRRYDKLERGRGVGLE